MVDSNAFSVLLRRFWGFCAFQTRFYRLVLISQRADSSSKIEIVLRDLCLDSDIPVQLSQSDSIARPNLIIKSETLAKTTLPSLWN